MNRSRFLGLAPPTGQQGTAVPVTSEPMASVVSPPSMPEDHQPEVIARTVYPTLALAMAMASAYEQATDGDRVDYDFCTLLQ